MQSSICRLALTFGGLCTLALTSCKDVTPPAQENVAKSRVNLGDKADAERIAASAYQHTSTILDFGHRQPDSTGLRKTKDYVIAQLKSNGWTCVEQAFVADTPKGKVNYSNLIARYAPQPNSKPWRKSVTGVIGAHIDSKILPDFLGADDAASCVATLLSLASHLHSQHPEIAGQLELVFFDGEEALGDQMTQRDGLYGSYYYSRAVRASALEKVHPYRNVPEFGVVLDMIGHKDLSIKIPADTPAKLRKSYTNARKKLKLEKHFGYSHGSFLDDHYPMNEVANIPTIDIIGDFSSNLWWHTSADNMQLISEESLSMSIQMALEIISNQL